VRQQRNHRTSTDRGSDRPSRDTRTQDAGEDERPDATYGIPASEQLRQATRVLRRRWPILVLVPLAAIFVSLVVSAGARKEYVATSQVVLDPVNQVNLLVNPASNVTSADPERDLNTEVSEISETPMADLVRRSLRLSESSQALLSQVNAAVEGTTNIVDIAVTDSKPSRAARIANTFATQYVKYRPTVVESQVRAAIALAQTRLAGMTPAELAGPTGQQLRARLAQLEADSATWTSDAHISQAASTPSSPVQPRPLRAALIAFIVGLVVALVAIVLMELLDESIRDEEDAAEVARLPILGVIPKPPADAVTRVLNRARGALRVVRGGGRARVARARNRGFADTPMPRRGGALPSDWEQEESYASLAIKLLSQAAASGGNVYVISSPAPEDGKTSVTLGLAGAIAELGHQVIAVECDLRRPRFARLLGLPPAGRGLSGLLTHQDGENGVAAGTGREPLPLVEIDARAKRRTTPSPTTVNGTVGSTAPTTPDSDPCFRVLPSGPIPHKPHAALAGKELPALVHKLRSMADIVLIDTPPLGILDDAVLLGPAVDEIIIVARLRHTRREALKRCCAQAGQVGRKVSGLVIVGGRRGTLTYYSRARSESSVDLAAYPLQETASLSGRWETEPDRAPGDPRSARRELQRGHGPRSSA
jgi:succinoglycan biosynthesis transport protein ExoP